MATYPPGRIFRAGYSLPFLFLLLLGPLLAPTPAFAHAGDAIAASDWRVRIVGLEPALPGITVRVVEGGARLELTNTSDRPVEVLGYLGEPYLEIRPDGVYQNPFSPATYLNASMDGHDPVPAEASPLTPPEWTRLSSIPVVRWHDHRAAWMSDTVPPVVQRDPTRTHHIRDWVVPLRQDTQLVELRGALYWYPRPASELWWAGGFLIAALVTAGGVPARLSRRLRLTLLAGVITVAGVAELVDSLGRAHDSGGTLAWTLHALLTQQMWGVVGAVAAFASAGYALATRDRPSAAELALALTGLCLVLFGGVPDVAVFGHDVAPVPWDGTFARLATMVTLAVGAGITCGCAYHLRPVPSAST